MNIDQDAIMMAAIEVCCDWRKNHLQAFLNSSDHRAYKMHISSNDIHPFQKIFFNVCSEKVLQFFQHDNNLSLEMRRTLIIEASNQLMSNELFGASVRFHDITRIKRDKLVSGEVLRLTSEDVAVVFHDIIDRVITQAQALCEPYVFLEVEQVVRDTPQSKPITMKRTP